MSRGVAGCADRLDHGVAELDELPVGEGPVGELGAGSLRQVGGGAGSLGESRESRDVVRLNVGLDHRDDLRALRVRGGDVVIDQVRMRVDDGELPRRLAAKQIGGAGRLVVEELAEVHWGLTTYQEFD